jgi:hypothetical protein
MGDILHKKPPPPDEEEEVTDSFRKQVREALAINDQANRIRRLKKGDPDYQVSNRPELAEAIGTDKTMINKIIGPVKASTKVKLVERSAFVGRIRSELKLAAVTRIAVRTDRAVVVRFIAELPDEEFKVFYDEYRRRTRKSVLD